MVPWSEVFQVGKHVVRAWSSTQPTVATSSGKAELIAMYDGATRELGMQTVMTEMGLSPQLKMIRVFADSSVAKSFVATRGVSARCGTWGWSCSGYKNLYTCAR